MPKEKSNQKFLQGAIYCGKVSAILMQWRTYDTQKLKEIENWIKLKLKEFEKICWVTPAFTIISICWFQCKFGYILTLYLNMLMKFSLVHQLRILGC